MGQVPARGPRSAPQSQRDGLHQIFTRFEDAAHALQATTSKPGEEAQSKWIMKKIPARGAPRTQICTAAQTGRELPVSSVAVRVWCGGLATKHHLLLVWADSSSSSQQWLGHCHPPTLASFCGSPVPTALPGHPDWAALIATWLLLVSIKTTPITSPLKTSS